MSEIGEGGGGSRSFEPPARVMTREQILKNAAALRNEEVSAMEGMRKRAAQPGTIQGARAREGVKQDEAKLRAGQEVGQALGLPVDKGQVPSLRAQDILADIRREIAQKPVLEAPRTFIAPVAATPRAK